MRRILYYSLLCFLWVSVDSCKDDDASTPPPPTLTLTAPTSAKGLLSADEFTFEVEQVGAGSISLLPYGTENPSFGGVLIPSSAFDKGVAKVKFTYGHVGTFQAVASSTNHSSDGGSVKTSYSSPVTVTITSDKASLSDFSFDGSLVTKVSPNDNDEAAVHNVFITVPWSKSPDLGKLKLRYSAAAESKVTVGSVAQESDKTENNFKVNATPIPLSDSIKYGPVVYTVTPQDGDDTKARTYNVYVKMVHSEQNANIKSLNAIITNKGKLDPTNAAYNKAQLKVATGRILPSYVNNDDDYIVIYDTLHVNPAVYDSLSLDFALDGKFSNAKYAAANWGKHNVKDRIKGKDTVNLKAPVDLIEVTPEDSVTATPPGVTPNETYTVYVAEAPRLKVRITSLTPNREATSNEAFAVGLDAINGTDLSGVDLTFDFDPADFDLPVGSTVTSVSVVQDNGGMPAVTGVGPFFALGVDLRKAIKVLATVDAPGSTPDFVVTYTVSVTVK
jgi:hypothetical protein